MNEIIAVFSGIFGLFLLLLMIKEIFQSKMNVKFCVLCTAVTLTWVSLLVSYKLGYFNDSRIIALLVGNTILGIFYLVEKKVSERLRFFRLPFYLTLLTCGYLLLGIPSQLLLIITSLAGLWMLFGGVYLFQRNPVLNSFVKKVVECCKNW
ncbi:hypothetical protein COV20_05695 [Candidatus Woesearchaeota archaeon CG10_big_fil_rev_8_21_14_0_10_45_16]|nr:MAG: hypothetical protein COV20_05695 [Candidatus Woesearchaeota archaeon CG10_big_fil_rev_8_21_14_0_10_45_16]